jgi:hypothetical protein
MIIINGEVKIQNKAIVTYFKVWFEDHYGEAEGNWYNSCRLKFEPGICSVQM